MKLYTIGFTQKSAERFFTLLKEHGVERVVDIRRRPSGQLAGFARGSDLPYFLSNLVNGCDYIHLPILAPSDELLDDYRKGIAWGHYVPRFEAQMDERNIPTTLDRSIFEERACCLLCSEPTPDKCHRRLVAERLAREWGGVEIVHIV